MRPEREWAPCRSCGDVRVLREVVPGPTRDRENVIVSCASCDNRRGAYERKRKK